MSFDPTQISGLTLWLDATAATTLTNSATAAPPALGNIADRSSVGTWFDNYGSGVTVGFSQATTAVQPTYLASGQLGKPAVAFPCAANGSGPALFERSPSLYTVLSGSETVLILLYKYQSQEGSFQTIFTNDTGGPQAQYLLRGFSGDFDRFNLGSTATLSENAVHALAYSFNSGTNRESLYLDSAAAPAFQASTGRPSMGVTAFQISDLTNALNGEFYEIIAYGAELSNAQIAQVFAFWNTKYGTSFNASAGPLSAPAISASAVTKTSQIISASSPSGGTSPYATQYYRSTVAGSASSIAISANLIAGATDSILNDTALSVQTNYYYVLKVTDSASATSLSSVLTAPTHGSITVKAGFLGDSITFGSNSTTTPVDQFALAMQATYPQLDVQTADYGVGGQTLRSYSRLTHAGGTDGGGGITGMITTLTDAGIQYVGIMEGTNDWGQSSASGIGSDSTYTATNYKADMLDVCSALTSAGITVYVNQLIYRNGADDATNGLPPWNTQLASISYGGKVRQGDTASYAAIKADPSLLTDGLHPGYTGDVLMGGHWAAAMGPSIVVDVTPRDSSSSSSSDSSLSSLSSLSSNSSSSSSSSSDSSASSLSSLSSRSSESSSSSSGSEPILLVMNQNPHQNIPPVALLNGKDPGPISHIAGDRYKYVYTRSSKGPVTVELFSPYADSEIHYETAGGASPRAYSPVYSGPLIFHRNATGSDRTVVKARIFGKNNFAVQGRSIRLEFNVY